MKDSVFQKRFERKQRGDVFVKQLDLGGKCETDINRFPAHLRIRQVPWAVEGGAG